jgi:hypothetical protein
MLLNHTLQPGSFQRDKGRTKFTTNSIRKRESFINSILKYFSKLRKWKKTKNMEKKESETL